MAIRCAFQFDEDTVMVRQAKITAMLAMAAGLILMMGVIATYKATIFINHDKKQTDTLKLLPAFYD